MMTFQIGNPGYIGVMNCLGQGGLRSLNALVYNFISGLMSDYVICKYVTEYGQT